MAQKEKTASPFLKWAGGKTQLIKQISQNLPQQIFQDKFTYIEPFIGSGAMLFWMLKQFPHIEKAVINDINAELIQTYRTIASRPLELISVLESIEREYHEVDADPEKKKEYFYEKRNLYNSRQEKTLQSALFIFLNRTCFNGLYRVNRKNEFNVPMGRYKTPTICDKENLLAVSKALQKVEILCGDYQQTLEHTGKTSFFYFDPPYKPLNQTSSFNSYASTHFNDEQQIRLRDFCKQLDTQSHLWMLSNSDVKTDNPEDNFFDELYADFYIQRVKAKRQINSKGNRRGELNELLITNYQ